MPSEVVPYNHSLCNVDGMYGANINGMTTTVDIRAMTALKRDGTALIPASLVNVLKGKRIFTRLYYDYHLVGHKIGSDRLADFVVLCKRW